VTLQVPETRVHVVELNVPVLLLVKVAVPVGVPVPPVTVAVHVLTVLSRTLAGEHATVVVDPPEVIATRNVPLLPVWTLFPP
jgi:hypothetical protein